MEDEPHEVVKLLLARMESHPEEFRLKDPSYHDRWYNHMSAINTYGNEADKAALAAKVRDIRMGVIHEEVMEELLNGEDRRRKEEEDREYERNLSQSLQHLKQQQLRVGTLSGDMNPTGYASGGGGGGGVMGTLTAAQPKPSPYDKIMNALKKGK
jgi:polyribonucleotide nucleotidyltransferase